MKPEFDDYLSIKVRNKKKLTKKLYNLQKNQHKPIKIYDKKRDIPNNKSKMTKSGHARDYCKAKSK